MHISYIHITLKTVNFSSLLHGARYCRLHEGERKKKDESWKEMEIGMNEENETVHDIHGPKSS